MSKLTLSIWWTREYKICSASHICFNPTLSPIKLITSGRVLLRCWRRWSTSLKFAIHVETVPYQRHRLPRVFRKSMLIHSPLNPFKYRYLVRTRYSNFSTSVACLFIKFYLTFSRKTLHFFFVSIVVLYFHYPRNRSRLSRYQYNFVNILSCKEWLRQTELFNARNKSTPLKVL